MMNSTYGNTGSQDPPRQHSSSASASTEELKGKAKRVGDDLKAKAKDAGDQARAKAETGFDQQTDKAADKVEGVADGIRAAADQLQEDDNAQMSEYLTRAASTIDGLADSMRNKSADELMRDVRQLAAKNPGLFLAGSVAVGFGLTRFARASSRGGSAGPATAGGRSASRAGGATSGSSAYGGSGSSASAATSSSGTRLPRSGNPAATPPTTPSPGVGNVRNNPVGKGGNRS